MIEKFTFNQNKYNVFYILCNIKNEYEQEEVDAKKIKHTIIIKLCADKY